MGRGRERGEVPSTSPIPSSPARFIFSPSGPPLRTAPTKPLRRRVSATLLTSDLWVLELRQSSRSCWVHSLHSFPDKGVTTRLLSNLPANALLAGTTLQLNCTADAVPPPYSYSFSHNGKALASSANGTLTIRQANVSHEGSYECTPHNILGAGQTATINITVLGKKTISCSLANIPIHIPLNFSWMHY